MTRLEKGIVSETGNGQRHFSRALGQRELTTSSNETRPTDNVSVAGPRRQREPRRYLDPEVASSLRRARLRLGWSLRTAAQFTGVDAGYMCHLEHGRRVPSVVTAEALISGLKLDLFEAEQLRAVALIGVGRDFEVSRYERERDCRT
ncbi:MAG: helix-turn-helix domain-containing protein [Acidimicrobiales bacterium]